MFSLGVLGHAVKRGVCSRAQAEFQPLVLYFDKPTKGYILMHKPKPKDVDQEEYLPRRGSREPG